MTNCYEETPQGRDPKLWEIAKRRASFRYHFATYLVVISAIWIFWSFASGEYNSYPWPIWPTMGWGIGLLFHFLGAFVFPHENSVEREYEKMIRNRK
ncbi:MAG TPA: 2TM domain-containing protein [Flavitalea sp.]|nr:2TM domain-containing protein [Flavitalea sp.]